jgi:3-phenylpropionate/cinnamic acid dioxygenase small subunit
MTPEQFLYHEAHLLDTQRYEEWLALFTEDATYWVPLEQSQKDPHETSSLVYDDRTLLELRVKQMRHPRAHARAPLPRTVHQVSNIVVQDLVVRSALTVVEFRSDKQRIWAGLVEHHLVRKDGTFRIARKRIDLVNSEGELEGLAILL